MSDILQFIGLMFAGMLIAECVEGFFSKDYSLQRRIETSISIRIFGMLTFIFLLTACGKDAFKKTEYEIDGVWRQCSQPAKEECGMTLICGDEVYQCMNNVPMR